MQEFLEDSAPNHRSGWGDLLVGLAGPRYAVTEMPDLGLVYLMGTCCGA